MRKHHPQNERIKRDYLTYLEEAKRMASASVDQVAAVIAQFEQHTRYKDFRQFHIQQAKAFKAQLNTSQNPETGRPLAKATIRARLLAMKAFVQWLAGQPGYRSRISYSDAEYFNPSANDERIATAQRERPVPTLEQIRHVLFSMPTETDIQKRNRAVIAFMVLTGARDDAVASLSLKHVDCQARRVFQDAREVRTKNRKTITSKFFPVGEDIEEIVSGWISFLAAERQFGPDEPLFPATNVGTNEVGLFVASGLSRNHWKDAAGIRTIFKAAFPSAGLPYFNPHSFRKTLALLGQRVCKSPEEYKAWSQNFGHEYVLTTFTAYGAVSSHRQADILESLRGTTAGRDAGSTVPDAATIQRVLDHLMKKVS